MFDLNGFWTRYKWWIIGTVAVIIIIAVVIGVAVGINSSKNKEGFSGTDTSININGHTIDCTPEIKYMEEYLNTSKQLK